MIEAWVSSISILWGGWELYMMLCEMLLQKPMWNIAARKHFYLGLPAWAWLIAICIHYTNW